MGRVNSFSRGHGECAGFGKHFENGRSKESRAGIRFHAYFDPSNFHGRTPILSQNRRDANNPKPCKKSSKGY